MVAFSDAEKGQIRQYLGYPVGYRYLNPRLEGMIDTVGQDATAVTMVQALLAKVADQLAGLTSASDNAGLKGLDQGGVEFYDRSELQTRRQVGRGFVAQLSIAFGVPIANDIFGAGGYGGDGWTATNGLSNLAGLG